MQMQAAIRPGAPRCCHRPDTKTQCCQGKKFFLSKAAADKFSGRQHYLEKQSGYKCPVCPGWHLSRTNTDSVAGRAKLGITLVTVEATILDIAQYYIGVDLEHVTCPS